MKRCLATQRLPSLLPSLPPAPSQAPLPRVSWKVMAKQSPHKDGELVNDVMAPPAGYWSITLYAPSQGSHRSSLLKLSG